jgi:hypothetical protein
MLVIKSRARHFPALRQRIGELHSYEVPEIIAIPIAAGSKEYLQWLAESTAAAMPRRTQRTPVNARITVRRRQSR